jgi:hypothetical protein
MKDGSVSESAGALEALEIINSQLEDIVKRNPSLPLSLTPFAILGPEAFAC